MLGEFRHLGEFQHDVSAFDGVLGGFPVDDATLRGDLSGKARLDLIIACQGHEAALREQDERVDGVLHIGLLVRHVDGVCVHRHLVIVGVEFEVVG